MSSDIGSIFLSSSAVEQTAVNRSVIGSTPVWGAKLLGYSLVWSKALVFEISIIGSNPITSATYGSIAQLDNAPAYEAVKWEFKSF